MLRLSVPQPCHEKWEDMTPTEKGAYCQSCSKVVTDFSNMTDEEVANYFLDKKETASCGRFRKSQLDRPLLYIPPGVLQMNIPYWKKFLAVLFICFSGLLTSCNNDQTTGKVVKQRPADITVLVEKTTPPATPLGITETKTVPVNNDDNCDIHVMGNIVTTNPINLFDNNKTAWEEFIKSSPDQFAEYFSDEK